MYPGSVGRDEGTRGGRFLHGGVEHMYLSYVPDAFVRPDALTDAEAEIAARVVRGASTPEIACERGVSVRTVANQLGSIYRKLGVCSRAELLRVLQR